MKMCGEKNLMCMCLPDGTSFRLLSGYLLLKEHKNREKNLNPSAA
jgi:hypothetical protein